MMCFFFAFFVVGKGAGEFNRALPDDGVTDFYPLIPGAAGASDQVCL
jgi:hypothetical protein